MKTAIISGITGQDGAYLSKLLISKGYRVFGLTRNNKKSNLKNLEQLNILSKVKILKCDLLDYNKLEKIIEKHKPSEIYNLAAQSSVGASFINPFETINTNTNITLNFLEAIRKINKETKFYQASSSEMYGKVNKLPIKEDSPLCPLSPYGVSKASSHLATINYRESFNIFAVCGILFNHESKLRDNNFFIKKVIKNSVEIHKGLKSELTVGNIEIKRDFGYSPEYVKAMWLMLQNKQPKDYIICSGKSIYLKDIIKYIFKKLKIPLTKLIISEKFFRPNEIKDIYGDNKNAIKELKWKYNLDFYKILDILINDELKKHNN